MNANLGDMAIDYLELFVLSDRGQATPAQLARMKEIKVELEASGEWSEEAAEAEYESRLKKVVAAQSARTYIEGRPGEVVIDGQGNKKLNRHGWAPGGDRAAQFAKAKKFIIATGGIDPVFGVRSIPLKSLTGGHQGILCNTLDRFAPFLSSPAFSSCADRRFSLSSQHVRRRHLRL